MLTILAGTLRPCAAPHARAHIPHAMPHRSHTHRAHTPVLTRGIKGIQDFDASFELAPEAEEALLLYLNSEAFQRQVINECRLTNVAQLEYTGILFQPVPWSPGTTKGMPKVPRTPCAANDAEASCTVLLMLPRLFDCSQSSLFRSMKCIKRVRSIQSSTCRR